LVNLEDPLKNSRRKGNKRVLIPNSREENPQKPQIQVQRRTENPKKKKNRKQTPR